jgi:hypothetical protein
MSREIARSNAHLPARVCGCTVDGKSFEEEAVVRDLGIQGAFIQLCHAPKLQSTLQVTLGGLDGTNGCHKVVLHGYVVRVEPIPETNRTGVGLIFTE